MRVLTGFILNNRTVRLTIVSLILLPSLVTAQTTSPPVRPADPPTASSPEPSPDPSPAESPVVSPSGGTTSPPVPTSASVSITGTNSNTGSGNTNPPEVTSSGTTSTPPTGPLKYDTDGPCDQETVAYTYDSDPNDPGGVVRLGWYSGGSTEDPSTCGLAAGAGTVSGSSEPSLRGFLSELVFGPDLREAIPGMSQFGIRCPQSFGAYKFMQLASDAMHAFSFLEGLIFGGLAGEAEQATLAATTRAIAPRTVAREVCEEVTESATLPSAAGSCLRAPASSFTRTHSIEGEMSSDVVKSLIESIRNGQEIPPISVWENGGKLYILDGHHRVVAFGELGGRVPYELSNLRDEFIERALEMARTCGPNDLSLGR